MFHPRPFVKTRFAPQGAVACIQAISAFYYTIAFRYVRGSGVLEEGLGALLNLFCISRSREGCCAPVAECVCVFAHAVVFPSKIRCVLAGREAKQFEIEGGSQSVCDALLTPEEGTRAPSVAGSLVRWGLLPRCRTAVVLHHPWFGAIPG